MRRILIACLPFAALIAMTGASLADCKSELVAMTGLSGPAKSDAEHVARVTWESRAAHTYSSEYSHWNKANNRKIECEKQTGGYQCWATASPCN
jgi:hypothetical protein